MVCMCRYHLQAFRHLYVLAADHRIIITRDMDTREACYVPLQVTLKVRTLTSLLFAFYGISEREISVTLDR